MVFADEHSFWSVSGDLQIWMNVCDSSPIYSFSLPAKYEGVMSVPRYPK